MASSTEEGIRLDTADISSCEGEREREKTTLLFH